MDRLEPCQQFKMKTEKKMINYGTLLALFSGLFAALASTSAKLVFNTDIVQPFCQLVSSDSSIILFQSIICSEIFTNVLWAVFVGCVVLFNVLMWITFTKALQYFTSTVEVSATNTASNFLFSAIFGWIIFSEHLNLQWFAGFFCIISGLYLIQKENFNQEEMKKNN